MGHIDGHGHGHGFFVDRRLKRMINAAGHEVWPAEVEAMLYGHPAIRDARIPDARRGETVKAFVVLTDRAREPDPHDLDAWCRERMASYKAPRIFAFVDDLSRTSMGKIAWRSLA